ncbi:guanitoxin biosynthesis heme-dependent pre-guanitoxin N-hydroxylase GntA [soil metagenome]
MQPQIFKSDDQRVIEDFKAFLSNKEFPCVAAKAALNKDQIRFFVAEHMACPKDDRAIFSFLSGFADDFRHMDSQFNSAVVLFKEPGNLSEEMFDSLLWKRLQSFSDTDSKINSYDKRVSSDPASPGFSFSINEEAFFVIGLNPQSSRLARSLKYPALVFNPHAQFEQMRLSGNYEKMKKIVRKRDLAYSGSVNPMLRNFGELSEVYQYSGKEYEPGWNCPLKINHIKN